MDVNDSYSYIYANKPSASYLMACSKKRCTEMPSDFLSFQSPHSGCVLTTASAWQSP